MNSDVKMRTNCGILRSSYEIPSVCMRPQDLLLAPELSAAEVDEFLRSYGFKDPGAADRNLQLMAEDFVQRELLARIIAGLLNAAQFSPDPDAAFNNFERFLTVVTHPANFLGFLGDTPEALEALVLLFGTSPFSSEILIRNPENFYWLLDQLGATWIRSSESTMQEARQWIGKFLDSESKFHALSRFKRREMLRIGARDILRIADIVGTVTELSNLADVVIQLVYEICYAKLVGRYGIPCYRNREGRIRPARFTVLGMGKLGGTELNYSSDIDLIYLYDGEQGNTQSPIMAVEAETTARTQNLENIHPQEVSTRPTSEITNPEFFTRLAQSITHELSDLTEEGYFYRVDLRLRPEGSAGSVAMSLTACKNYYSSWGETFERLALTKARPVAGSKELGEEFCEALNGFVYRKFLDFAALDEIQEIKGRITLKLGSKEKQASHVKLGPGGIREIEFFVQALQLIYGGRHRDLQERNTLMSLDKLRSHHFLSAQEHRQLREAYMFLRDLEHKLQMVFHFQTHELPSDPEELYRCARRMGFAKKKISETVDEFARVYKKHTAHVSRIFQNLISLRRVGASDVQLRETALILNKNLKEEDAFALLTKRGFEDLRTAFHQIVLLRDAPSFAHSPSKMRNLLANLLPSLLEGLESSPDADAGLIYFEKFASALGERNSLYTLLNESPEVLQLLIRVLSSGPFLAEFLCRRPEFFDLVNRLDDLQKRKSLHEFRSQLRQSLEYEATLEASQTALRRFQQTELFRIGVKDILGQLQRAQVGNQLADLAGVCLEATIDIGTHELATQFGKHFPLWIKDHFAVLALGKLGGNDLSYNSDLDLIFFYWVEDLSDTTQTQLRLVKLIETIDGILNVSRGEGSIYKIDLRLRPDGKKGELVVALHKYQEYLASRAEPWERLALVRHRFLTAGSQTRVRLQKLIEGYVYQPRLEVSDVTELLRIRQRMETELGKENQNKRFHLKAGVGGLVDIEFATQLLQLKYGHHFQELRIPNTLAALRRLKQLGLIRNDQYETLRDSYEFLRLVENRLRVAFPYSSNSVDRDPKNLKRIGRLLGRKVLGRYSPTHDFEDAYLSTTQRVRTVFEEISGALLNTPERTVKL
jgi:[glutamine synthetase] adenylyltransferase / [glutamine synthetase]-adenylyl-L-tyrosine phosphorylase